MRGLRPQIGVLWEAEAHMLSVPDDGGLRERTLAYVTSPHARDTIRRRKAWIETIVGDGKERRGLRRAHYRGLDWMSVQAWMARIAQNVRQLALHAGRLSEYGAAALRQGPGTNLSVRFSLPSSAHAPLNPTQVHTLCPN